MSWPGFFAPSAAALFALIGPLVLFYFLKLKRARLAVPSLVLWQQVLKDSRVNSPFQKFKRNILLLLQLLLLILLILAAMQPYWRGSAERANRLPVLIDCSASMAALDEETGKSRLDIARQQVRELIDGMLPDQQLCLISFGRTAQRMTGFTDNKRVLHEALNKIEPRDVTSNVEDALRMAQALALREPFETIRLISDGNLPAQADVDLSFSLDYQQLPAAGNNLAITALNAQRTGATGWDVFVRIESTADAAATGTVELYEDDHRIGAEDIALAKGQSQRLVFAVPTDRSMALTVRLLPDDFDSLASDNTAYLDLNPPRSLLVYAPKELLPYRLALNVIENIKLFPADDNDDERSSYDLVISDQPEDVDLDTSVGFFVGVVPDDIQQLLTIDKDSTSVVDWRRDAPVLRYVELTDLIISDNPRSGPEVTEQDYENIGYKVLAHGRNGPLLLKKQIGPQVRYFLLFHSDRSTLPYRVGFPILVSNLVKIAMRDAGLSEVPAIPTGVLPPIAVEPGTGLLRVDGPGGRVINDAQPDADSMLTGIAALRAGRYVIKSGSAIVADIGASLLSATESSLTTVDQIQFRELSVARAAVAAKTDRSFWRTLAIVALVLLVVEWWYFHRKPGGFNPGGFRQ